MSVMIPAQAPMHGACDEICLRALGYVFSAEDPLGRISVDRGAHIAKSLGDARGTVEGAVRIRTENVRVSPAWQSACPSGSVRLWDVQKMRQTPTLYMRSSIFIAISGSTAPSST